MDARFVATCGMGIETVVRDELRRLDLSPDLVQNGRVWWTGHWKDLIRSLIWIRTADRIFWNIKQFKVGDYEDLFQGIRSIDWKDCLPRKSKIRPIVRSDDEKVRQGSSAQAIVKKAVMESLKRSLKVEWVDESGPESLVEVWISAGEASVMLDAAGEGLHRRGYRQDSGLAPLKETLAAAIVILSRWNGSEMLADPVCGSGTIPIEAALIAGNIAPGRNRRFAAEQWPMFSGSDWKSVREAALSVEEPFDRIILGSDIDYHAIQNAVRNASRAGVQGKIVFQKKPLEEFSSKKKTGWLICNPPYGERIQGDQEIARIYKGLGMLRRNLPAWNFYILSGHPEFARLFGDRAARNRKLYNARIKCYLYQFPGVLSVRDESPGAVSGSGEKS